MQGTSAATGWPAGSGRREGQRGEGGLAHSIETPSFAHGSQMMFKKKSKSVERVAGGQTTLGMAKMQRMRPVRKRRPADAIK